MVVSCYGVQHGDNHIAGTHVPANSESKVPFRYASLRESNEIV